MACILGHKWDGCKCTKCDKTRDSNHKWATVEKRIEEGIIEECCSVCGAKRNIDVASKLAELTNRVAQMDKRRNT